jgi:adenylate kinase
MKILILGAPGAGKGTYSKGLSETLKLPLISTGDILRSLRNDPKVGSTIREYQDKGLPVPDNIVIPLVQERLNREDCKKGAIIDGDVVYNINQAKMMEKITNLDLVVNLVLPDSILIKKNLGRRNCKNCGITFNVAEINEQGIHMPALPPKKEGICDKCGGPLFIRTDDTEEIMRERLKIYWERINPVLKFYRNKGLVRDVKVNASPDIMVPKILELVKKELGVKK